MHASGTDITVLSESFPGWHRPPLATGSQPPRDTLSSLPCLQMGQLRLIAGPRPAWAGWAPQPTSVLLTEGPGALSSPDTPAGPAARVGACGRTRDPTGSPCGLPGTSAGASTLQPPQATPFCSGRAWEHARWLQMCSPSKAAPRLPGLFRLLAWSRLPLPRGPWDALSRSSLQGGLHWAPVGTAGRAASTGLLTSLPAIVPPPSCQPGLPPSEMQIPPCHSPASSPSRFPRLPGRAREGQAPRQNMQPPDEASASLLSPTAPPAAPAASCYFHGGGRGGGCNGSLGRKTPLPTRSAPRSLF